MKIKKVKGYEPKYPMKSAAKVGALAAAALITAGAAAGCTPRYNGFLEFSTPQPTEVALDGDIAVDPAELNTDCPGDVEIEGELAVDPAEINSDDPGDNTEGPEFMGDIMPDPAGGK